jgi:carboxylate-amine ligase
VLTRFLYTHPEHNAGIDVVDRAIAVENKWRAQRYGAQGTFATRSGTVMVGDLLDHILDLTATDAEILACRDQAEQCRAIMLEGTSADAQLRIFAEHEHQGEDIALYNVTRWIRDATLLA